jgi:cobalt-zinc-cadmium efflux system membrane fusion protein
MTARELRTTDAPRPSPWRALSLGAAAGIAVLFVLASTLFHRKTPPALASTPGMRVGKNDVTLSESAPQWKVIRLGTAAPPAEHWTEPFPARFKVDETRAAKVGAPLAGRVTAVLVELGQPVKTGQSLFTIASPDVAGLRAEQQKAAVDLEVAKSAFQRVKAMVEARALPAKDEIESDQQLRQAELALHLAQNKLSSLRVSQQGDNQFTVVSPRDGVVIAKTVLPSQQVTPDTSLISVADLADVWVVAELFEADAAGLSAGAKARITSPSIPGLSVDADVAMVSSVVDPDRHTVPVRVKLPNTDGRIRPNTYAEMRFRTAVQPGTIDVAAAAIVSDGRSQYVYAQEGPGHFVRHSVVAGPARDGRVVVTRGLDPGDVVVEQGAVLLDNQIDLSN